MGSLLVSAIVGVIWGSVQWEVLVSPLPLRAFVVGIVVVAAPLLG